MKLRRKSADQKELWEGMDIVIGATPIPDQDGKVAPLCENVQSIRDPMKKRQGQEKAAARAAA